MSVIERSVQIMDELATAGAPVMLTDLSARTGLPLTTVHRLCAQLLAEQLIERGEGGGLMIGTRTWVLGRRHARTERTRFVAGRFLHDLHEVTRGTVDLVLLDGERLRVVERLSGLTHTRADWRSLPEGVPLHRTSAGVAILAARSDHSVAELRRAAGPEEAADVDAAIRDARAGRVVRRADPLDGRRVTLAAAIRTRGEVDSALVLTVDGDRAARVQAPSVLVTARRITAALAAEG
ncbi:MULTISPECIES: helix-turn-helix domain-containing protein [unclassified Microbacterium]|uniref:helix-turn-helix domain-containing protein n=1 Tax=unclassified Microbacterium TaxID=2609290 RepID=UPI00214C0447|nr:MULTISPECIES: helix-turn-helix domain-containing protein [unclassified Microbacterium]MCR2783287.1 helix-turn-helix domain-containing protein [Microbacterium sp. zg.B96]MDL5351929.1 helix-turn-helix domain-containing protein [Microbacterium sp. zg-YB36]WIM15838.1 helix-turn-helix domain-containing protein [Microbacterium sp. zg-B96]